MNDIDSEILERQERRRQKRELEKTRKKHARKLGILSFILSISIYKILFAILSAIGGDVIPLKWILLALGFILGSLAHFWHKKFRISMQHAAGAAVIGSAMSFMVLAAIWIITEESAN